jgi:hypothetical protein
MHFVTPMDGYAGTWEKTAFWKKAEYRWNRVHATKNKSYTYCKGW